MTPGELLEAGIAVIERNGWHQGAMYEGSTTWLPEELAYDDWTAGQRELGRTKPVCALGSLYRAATGTAAQFDVPSMSVANTIAGANRLLADVVGRMVPEFNDDPTTTREDVLLAMKKAAHHG